MATTPTVSEWSDAEKKKLEELSLEFPSSEHSFVGQAAKIAARLPGRGIRDVGARLRALALDPAAVPPRGPTTCDGASMRMPVSWGPSPRRGRCGGRSFLRGRRCRFAWVGWFAGGTSPDGG